MEYFLKLHVKKLKPSNMVVLTLIDQALRKPKVGSLSGYYSTTENGKDLNIAIIVDDYRDFYESPDSKSTTEKIIRLWLLGYRDFNCQNECDRQVFVPSKYLGVLLVALNKFFDGYGQYFIPLRVDTIKNNTNIHYIRNRSKICYTDTI